MKDKNRFEIFRTFSNSERSSTLITFAEHSYFLVLKHLNCIYYRYLGLRDGIRTFFNGLRTEKY